MKKTLKKAIILAVIFVAAVILYFTFNQAGRNQDGNVYAAMEGATLPVAYVSMYGRDMNLMHGYRQDMGNVTARDSLTILPEDRALHVRIAGYDGNVLGIRYEIRSLDQQRLVENTRLESWGQEADEVTAVLPIQNLLTKEKEYLLRLDVDTEEHGTVYYYTRIMLTDNTNIQSMIDLAVDFSARTFDYEQAKSLVTYLETNDTEDNSTFGKTTIRSSFSMLTWGRLKMQPLGDVQVTLKELDGVLGCIQLKYLATRQGEGENAELYEVEENFTLKWNALRTYMMDYERTVNQIFQGDQDSYAGKRIMLGITNDDRIGVKRSPGGTMLAFLANRDLWSYDQNDRRAVKIFSFRGEEAGDVREGYDRHDIRILDVEDNGDMDFLVYGYMNRGRHEGQMGVAGYHYDESANAIEERFFIPVQSTYEQLEMDMQRLANKTKTDMLYLYVDHAIYGIDLQSNEYMVVADALSEGTYAISADKSRIAWQEGGRLYESKTVNLMDLDTGEKKEIHAPEGELVRTLGFVGVDLVYGLAREGDLWIENGRVRDLPMYALEIMNQDMEVETRYEKSGSYISGVSVEESRIHLNRVSRLSEQSYSAAQEDTIVCNAAVGPDKLDGIGWYASQDKGKLYFVQVGNEIRSSRNVRVSTPKRVSYDKSETLELKSNYQLDGMAFYAYGGGRLLGVSLDFTEALKMAYDRMGIVVGPDQDILWSRINREPVRNIKEPVTAFEPLNRHMEGFLASRKYSDGVTVLDARGCSLAQVLYFVDQGIPVLAYTGEGEYLLVCGYDQYNVTVYNPVTRETMKVGLNDSTEYFRLRGNDFVCAISNE